MEKPLKMVRYGTTAEQKYIDQFRNDFDLLLINGNMLAYAGNAMSRAVATKGHLEYVVDPLTHGFQHQLDLLRNEKGEIKASIRKMMNAYGRFIVERIESDRTVTPSDFDSNTSEVEDFVSLAMRFQRDYVSQFAAKNDYEKYLRYANVQLKPKWLVVPYFCMNALTHQEWLQVNLRLIEVAKKVFAKEPLAAQLVIEKDLLEDSSTVTNMVDRYVATGLQQLFLWVDDFSAFDCSAPLLRSFANLVARFSEKGVNVYNLYGDYFSVLLCHPELQGKFGLKGVCHGLDYGESRQVIPVGGGIPINKYYFPTVHQRLPFRDALSLLGLYGIQDHSDPQVFFDKICGCPECRQVIGDKMKNFFLFGESTPVIIRGRYGPIERLFPTQEAKEKCIRHFLHAKLNEWGNLKSTSLSDLLDRLEAAGEIGKNVLGAEISATFRTWKEVLS